MIEGDVKNETVLAVIVVYEPDMGLLQNNINAFINNVDKLMIWDNTPGGSLCNMIHGFGQNKIFYQGVGKNIGISKALNYALRYAYKEGFGYLLTMDQDSIWHDFAAFKNAVMKKNEYEECICGPYAGIDVPRDKTGFELNRWQITSGMLVKTNLLMIIGGYNEAFMVDCVDIELCLRAKTKGYNSYYCYEGFLQQRYGTPSKTIFLGKERNYTYYSPFRVRSILGGHIYLNRKYKHPELPKEIRFYTKEAVKSMLYSHKKTFQLLVAIIGGFFDGLKMRKELFIK